MPADGSNLTLGASVIGVKDEILQAQADVQVNAPQSSGNFYVLAGNDYLAGTGPITAGTIDINTGRNLNFTTAQYPYGDSFGQSVVLNAGNAVNIKCARGYQRIRQCWFHRRPRNHDQRRQRCIQRDVILLQARSFGAVYGRRRRIQQPKRRVQPSRQPPFHQLGWRHLDRFVARRRCAECGRDLHVAIRNFHEVFSGREYRRRR